MQALSATTQGNNNTLITASKRRVRGAGKSRRALSPWCHVALSGRLSVVLSASSVDRCINVVVRRWARSRSDRRGGERWVIGKNHSMHQFHNTHSTSVQSHAMGHTHHWGGSDGCDGVVWPWCRSPKKSGRSAPMSAECPPAPHARSAGSTSHRRVAGVMCVPR